MALTAEGRRWADPGCTIELVHNPDDLGHGIVWERGGVVAEIHRLRRYPAIDVYAGAPPSCALDPEGAVLMSFVEGPLDLAEFPMIAER